MTAAGEENQTMPRCSGLVELIQRAGIVDITITAADRVLLDAA